jgi:hypothetical protein
MTLGHKYLNQNIPRDIIRSQGKLVQEDKFPSFIKKSAKLFNLFDEKLKRSDNKDQAKRHIRSSLQIIRSGLASV